MPTNVAPTLRQIAQEVGQLYFERESAIEAALLAILAGEHAFFLGPPGTGKSELSRAILRRIVGDPCWVGPRGEAGIMLWDTQLTRFTPPEKMFGAVDVPALRTGNYHHKIDGFLPTARFAHVDEIGKCNPAALGAMLSATNERIYHNDGAGVMDIPLSSMFACSNEELTAEDDNAAIWDRLLVRVLVEEIKDPANFQRLLLGAATAPASHTTVDYADLAHAIATDVPAIAIPVNIAEACQVLRESLRREGLAPSSRRFRKGVRLMQASAYLNGRSQVEDDDLAALRFVFWDAAEDITKVERAVLTLSSPQTADALAVNDMIDKLEADLRKTVLDSLGLSTEKARTAKATFGTKANGDLKVATNRLHKIRNTALAAGRSTTKIDEVAERIGALKREVYTEALGMDPALIRA